MQEEKKRYPYRYEAKFHDKILKAANKEHLSMNQLIDKAVREYIARTKHKPS